MNETKATTKPYCSKCFTTEPKPGYIDESTEIYWIQCDIDGNPVGKAIDIKGNISDSWNYNKNKLFDYNRKIHGALMCAPCVTKVMEE